MPAQETAEGGYDFVLDAAGGPQIENGYRGLAEGGTLVSIVQPVDEERARQKNALAVRYSAKPDGARLAELVGDHSIFAEPMIAATLPSHRLKRRSKCFNMAGYVGKSCSSLDV